MRSDQAILDACLRAGVWLPHACTHGTCGACKLQVLDGDIEHDDSSDFALLEFERTEGKALICVATPNSDVTVEADVEAEVGVIHYPVSDYVGTVAQSRGRGPRDAPDPDRSRPRDGVQPGPVRHDRGAGDRRDPHVLDGEPTGEPGRIELQIRRTPGGLATDGWVFKHLAER